MTLRHWGWIRFHVALWLVALFAIAAFAPRWMVILTAAGFVASMAWVGTRVAPTVALDSNRLVWRTPLGLSGTADVDQLCVIERAGGSLSGVLVVLRFVDDRSVYLPRGPQLDTLLVALARLAPEAEINT